MSKRNRIKNNPEGKRKGKGTSQNRLSSYDPVAIEIPEIAISEDEIEEQMLKTAERFPEYSRVEGRAIQSDDFLLISLTTVSGSSFIENLTYERHRIDLSDPFIPQGLRDHLLTMAPGSIETVAYEAPGSKGNTGEDPVLIPVTSTVTLHEIQEATTPTLSDSWVSQFIPGANTVEEFRSRVRRQMEGKANAYSQEMKYSQCAAVLASRLENSIPDELFEQGIQSAKGEFENMLKQTGMTQAQYLMYQGITEEQLTFQFMAKGRQMISEGMALEAMADHLSLTVEEEDINAVFGDVTPQQAKNMRDLYERSGKGDDLRRMAYCGKALEYTVAHAQITPKRTDATLSPFGDILNN